MRDWRLSVILLVGLTGCGGGVMQIPSSEVIDSTGQIVTKTASTVGDASTYRTHEKYQAVQRAAIEYTNAYKMSGTHIETSMIQRSVTIQQGKASPITVSWQEPTISVVDVRDRPTMQAIPELHDHPIWHTIDNFVSVATPWGFGTWAATSIVSSMEAVADRPSNQYNGPTQITGSYNSAGRDSTIEANLPRMDQSARTDSPGCSNGDCGGEGALQESDGPGTSLATCSDAWVVANIPGCSGCGSYYAGRCSVKP